MDDRTDWNNHQNEPALGTAESAHVPVDLDFSNIAIARDTPAIAAVPDALGAPPLAAEQHGEAVKVFGAQVQGVLAPLRERIETLITELVSFRDEVDRREQLLLIAATENGTFADLAGDQVAALEDLAAKLRGDLVRNEPVLPAAMAKAA